MGTEQDKFKKSKRLLKDENAVKKQTKIAKSVGLDVKQPHRLEKHHATDCGNPECFLCGNPRKTHKDKLTAQEKRLFQDMEQSKNNHTNVLNPKE